MLNLQEINSAIAIAELQKLTDIEDDTIQQLQLTNYPNFPLTEFLSISFTHHNYIMQDFLQPMGVATYKTADEMEPEILKVLPPKEELIRLIDGEE